MKNILMSTKVNPKRVMMQKINKAEMEKVLLSQNITTHFPSFSSRNVINPYQDSIPTLREDD